MNSNVINFTNKLKKEWEDVKQVLLLNAGSGTDSRLCFKICCERAAEQQKNDQVTYRDLGSRQSQKLK